MIDIRPKSLKRTMTDRLEVADRILNCERCELHARCTLPVPFHGPTPATIAVVGEAPGAQEDKAGQPFVGPAGQMIRKHLEAVGIDPEAICWINTASCFPHGTPQWDHVVACAENKRAQLELADPKWVLLLGKVALRGQNRDLEIKRVRGKAFLIDGRVNFVTYHPSAALRNGNYERAMVEDLQNFKAMIDGGRWTAHISDHCLVCGKWAEWFGEDGMALCLDHSPVPKRSPEVVAFEDPWERQTWNLLTAYLSDHELVFVDEFWVSPRVDQSAGVAALVPLFRRAAQLDLMRKTGRYRPSPVNNMAQRPVWRSCAYQGVLLAAESLPGGS